MLSLAAVALAATLCGPSRPPANVAGEASIPLEPYAGRLVTVAAKVGPVQLRLLLDTGGGQTSSRPMSRSASAAARTGGASACA